MLKMTGAMILVVGMTAGLVLLTSPFGIVAGASASPATWLLFPAGFLGGGILLALGDAAPALGALWRLCAALLLSLTIASAAAILCSLLGWASPVGHTSSLWYVLVLAGGAGTLCALGPGKSPSSEIARS
jgi:hypothetical protein